jgi:hypothetical protein
MTFADIISRIGAAIGGWLIFTGHCLTLSVLPQADCDPASDELWRGTLLFAFVSAIALLFVGRGLRWAASLRWLTVPAIGLAALAAWAIAPAIIATSLAGESLCAIAAPTGQTLEGVVATGVERSWPVVQLGVILFGLVQASRTWIASFAPSQD